MSDQTPPAIEKLSDRIVVMGAHTILGQLVIEQLERSPEVDEYWVIDLHPCTDKKSKKLHFIKLDLTEPGSDGQLAKKLEEIKATTLIHTMLKNNPTLNWVHAHELEAIGTWGIVNALKAANLRKFIFCSTTAVYGASPKNPNYLSEDHPLCQSPDAHFVRDKVEAERAVASLYHEASPVLITTLRFCLILGPRAKNYFTELFRRPLVPTLLGYDPLMQFLHEEDAARALRKVILEDHPGTFNIVGKGVIPLSYALREAGKVAVPIAPAIAYPLVQALWNLQLMAVPGRLLDYFRYLWVADGEKAKRLLNFESTRTSKDVFLEFAKIRRLQEYQ